MAIFMSVVFGAAALWLAALVGAAWASDDKPRGVWVVLLLAVGSLWVAIGAQVIELDSRWSHYSVCVDGETRVGDTIIADCKSYYDHPPPPNEN